MKLMPRSEVFFDDFERQAGRIVDGCQALVALTTSREDVTSAARQIAEIEHDCDRITHGLIEKLHTTFITPLDRNDIHRLTTKMDDVMDFIEAAAERFALYDIQRMTEEVAALASVLLESCKCMRSAVEGLRNLKHAKQILETCIEINRLENKADALLRSSLAKLFREERDPIAILKWKEIYELLETASDRCEDVANIIEGIILENS